MSYIDVAHADRRPCNGLVSRSPSGGMPVDAADERSADAG
jgi:hypothetical protein